MDEKQEATKSGSDSSIEPPGGGGEIATISKQIAKLFDTLIASYLGHSYHAKNGASELPEVWRWLNATFGSLSLAVAIGMPSPLTVRRAVLTASAVILLGAGVAVAQEQKHCDVPNEITLDGFIVRAWSESKAVHLEPIDLATRIKWTIGILVPGLVKNEVGIHLYKLSEINRSHVNLDDKHVIAFIVCQEENAYWAKRATIERADNNASGEAGRPFPWSNGSDCQGGTKTPRR